MTLSEAKASFEQGKTVISAEHFCEWARFRKSDNGDPWPLSRAPNGKPFLCICSSGEHQEGNDDIIWYRTREEAIERWRTGLGSFGYRFERPILHWRIEPELHEKDGRFCVYSRFLVSEG